jgi:hypothetical protein
LRARFILGTLSKLAPSLTAAGYPLFLRLSSPACEETQRSWYEKELCLPLVSPLQSAKQLSRGSKVHQLAVLPQPLQATRKRKIDSINNVCQYPRKRHHSAAVSLTREALIRLALPSTQPTKPEQLLEDDRPSPADMSSQATASEDQSQVPTPSTITPDLPAFEHELRRCKVLDADAEEISE